MEVLLGNQEYFKNIGPEEQKRFFLEAYNILSDKYGRENVISATVHLDEKAPHMHFKFIPITKDHKLRGGELTNKPHLSELHTIVAQRLKDKGFDIQRGEHEVEKREHLTPQKFKVAEMEKQISKRIEKVAEKVADLDEMERDVQVTTLKRR